MSLDNPFDNYLSYDSSAIAVLEGRILPREEVFPVFDPMDPKVRDEWYMNEFYASDMYLRYTREKDFRRAMNLYQIDGILANESIDRALTQVVYRNESLISECNGMKRSGKSYLIIAGIDRKIAEIAKRNLVFHANLDGKGDDPFKDSITWDVCADFNARMLADKLRNPSRFNRKYPGWQPEVWGNDPIHVYLTFNTTGSRRALKHVKRMDIINQDEMEELTGQMSDTFEKELDTVLDACAGQQQINFTFNNPGIKTKPQIQCYFQMLGYKENEHVTRAMVSTPSGCQGVIEYFTTAPVEVLDFYKKAAYIHKEGVLRNQGSSKAGISEVEEGQLITALIDRVTATGYPLPPKRYQLEYNSRQVDGLKNQPEPIIKRVIDQAMDKFKFVIAPSKGSKQAPGQDPGEDGVECLLPVDQPGGFAVTDEELLKHYKGQGKNGQDYAAVYLRIKNSNGIYTQGQAAGDLNVNQGTISRQLNGDDKGFKGIKGWLSDERGNAVEDYLADEGFKARYRVWIKEVVHEKDKLKRYGKADFIIYFKSVDEGAAEGITAPRPAVGDIHVVSVKSRGSADGDVRRTYLIYPEETKDGLAPELKIFDKLVGEHPGKDIRLYLLFNNMRHRRWGEKLLDRGKLPGAITCTVPKELVATNAAAPQQTLPPVQQMLHPGDSNSPAESKDIEEKPTNKTEKR